MPGGSEISELISMKHCYWGHASHSEPVPGECFHDSVVGDAIDVVSPSVGFNSRAWYRRPTQHMELADSRQHMHDHLVSQ